jgi:hypothetical protein
MHYSDDVNRTLPATLTLVALAFGACGGDPQEVLTPVRRETPADAIRRVGEAWAASEQTKGLRSHPSPIAVYRMHTKSTVRFTAGKDWTQEHLEIDEAFEMRDGTRYVCRAEGRTRVDLVFGRRHGEPAVEMRRPATRLTRTCEPPGFPDPEVTLPETTARFKLKADQLMAFDPPVEKRVYLPVQ